MTKLFAAGFAAVLLAGCSTYHQGRDWWTVNPQTIASIQPGATSKGDVERQLGRPLLAMNFARQQEEVWDYRYLNGTFTYVAEMHFDPQGRTKYVATYPDRCALRPVPCR
jgi:outer membrane protein assembly factor BamE (lipoprotein component of BamABCDE complex)